MTATNKPTIELTKEHGGLQLSIWDDDGTGYRIFGPKFSGGSRPIHVHTLSEYDAREIRKVLDKHFPVAPEDGEPR